MVICEHSKKPSNAVIGPKGQVRHSLWTIARLLAWSADYLKSQGFDTPRLEGELLLATALEVRRIDLYLDFQRPLGPSELADFKKLLFRRLGHEPMAYIIGRKAFYTLELAVGPGALIPRPETETLVEAALDLLPGPPEDAGLEILDLGTGCGPVVLSLAADRPGLQLTAADISTEALDQCRANAKTLAQEVCIEFLCGDLFSPLTGRRFDLIVMNPPYVSLGEYAGLAPEITDYEPAAALLAGEDGLDLIARLIAQAPDYLKERGWLLFEMGAGQGAAVKELLAAGPWEEIAIHLDLAGRDRVGAARLKERG